MDGKQPVFAYNNDGAGGLMLRDYFAAKAMQGIVVNFNKVGPGWVPNDCSMVELSKNAYEIADAMLKQRDKE